jgi:hypothetical protein
MPFGHEEEEEDPTFDEVSAMADRLGLKGRDRQSYIDDHMTGLGYDAVQSRSAYVKRQEQEEDQSRGGYGQRWGFQGSRRGNSQRQARDNDDHY